MPAVTYSILARDPGSGRIGVAVQSHFFSVGSLVPWARAGVGAVATQSILRVDYGPRGLESMARGASAPDALAGLLAADPGADSRQVAMIDATGTVACHTGSQCIPHAGDLQGDGVCSQANLMARAGVPEAMLDAFLWESGPLAHRLLAALEAAEAAGGDGRPPPGRRGRLSPGGRAPPGIRRAPVLGSPRARRSRRAAGRARAVAVAVRRGPPVARAARAAAGCPRAGGSGAPGSAA